MVPAPVVPKIPVRAAPVAKSEDVCNRIIEKVSDGTPLAEVCRESWAPHVSTFYDWLNDDPNLDRRFARAREIGHDTIAARTRDIARGKEGSTNDVKRDRLIVDTDLKLLSKWDRRYGERTTLAGDPDAPLVPPATDPVAAIEAILRNAQARKDAGDLA